MKFDQNEHTTEMLIKRLEKKYGTKTSGSPFNKNDVQQYILRGRIPYKYGGEYVSAKNKSGVRVIILSKN